MDGTEGVGGSLKHRLGPVRVHVDGNCHAATQHTLNIWANVVGCTFVRHHRWQACFLRAWLFHFSVFRIGLGPSVFLSWPVSLTYGEHTHKLFGIPYRGEWPLHVPRPEDTEDIFKIQQPRELFGERQRVWRKQSPRPGSRGPVYLPVGDEVTIADTPSRVSLLLCRLDPSRDRGNPVGNLVLDAACDKTTFTLPDDGVLFASDPRSPSDSHPTFGLACSGEWVHSRQLVWEENIERAKTEHANRITHLTPDGLDKACVEEHRVRWYALGSVLLPGSQTPRPIYCSDWSFLSTVIGPDTAGDIWLPVGWRVALAEGVSGEFTTCRRGICSKETLWGLANPTNTCVGSAADCLPHEAAVLASAAWPTYPPPHSCLGNMEQGSGDGASWSTSNTSCESDSRKTRSITAAAVVDRRKTTGSKRNKKKTCAERALRRDATTRKDFFSREIDKTVTPAPEEAESVEVEAESSSECTERGAVEVSCPQSFGHYVEPIQLPHLMGGEAYYLLGKTAKARIYCKYGGTAGQLPAAVVSLGISVFAAAVSCISASAS